MLADSWKLNPITIDAWKASCLASSRRCNDQAVMFTEYEDVISCWIVDSQAYLGSFFIKGGDLKWGSKILPSTGWNHP